MQNKIDINEEIYNRFWPVIVHFIENGNDINKIYSNMDLYYENMRLLESLKHQVEKHIKDLNSCKKLILDKTLEKKELEKTLGK